MWPFKKTTTIRDSGILNGITDWHSHILPGVDDGVKTMEESLAILSDFEELGVRRVWLTPHIMEDYPNTPADLQKRFGELKAVYAGGIELRLAAENMLDNLFEERLEANDLLPIGEEGNHLLVETSYYTPPYGMDDMIESIFSKGYFPILAHPERYRHMDEKEYLKLHERGVKMQVNYLSLVGGYGDQAKKKAEWLLGKGLIGYAGSDIHRESVIKLIGESKGEEKRIKMLSDVNNNK
ncbi:MAG: capsular biosynthesis protein [Muribaculaceae bacterium]|nr:capsular biosynthesis protein [Muribaculaceae bacterium]